MCVRHTVDPAAHGGQPRGDNFHVFIAYNDIYNITIYCWSVNNSFQTGVKETKGPRGMLTDNFFTCHSACEAAHEK